METNNKHNLTVFLYTERLKRGLSISEAARNIDVSQSYYYKIENEGRRPSPKIAKKIGGLLGFDHMRFFE